MKTEDDKKDDFLRKIGTLTVAAAKKSGVSVKRKIMLRSSEQEEGMDERGRYESKCASIENAGRILEPHTGTFNRTCW